MRRASVAAWLAVALVAVGARAEETHSAAARVAYIDAALAAVGAASAAARADAVEYARAMAHGACASPTRHLQVECLMTAARRFCRGRDARCNALVDIAASNVIADEDLIPSERRYEIMRDEKDYRRALAAETRRIEGALAVSFHLRTGAADDDPGLARAIDGFCRVSADDTNLPWQACVSSLVWFIRGEAHAQ